MAFSFEINPRLLIDHTRQSSENFQPLYSYEQESLLSLEEACQSLENVLDTSLHLYITVAKLNSKEPKHGLTQDESASIYLYTMEWTEPQHSLHVLLNQAFCANDRSQLEPWNKYLTLFFGALSKLPYSKCNTVWRGVAKDVSKDYRVGEEWTWQSLTSTTSSFDALQSPMYLGREKVQTVFAIETKYGKSIREHSHLTNEDEILLLPGIVLEVTECSKRADGIYIIHLRDVERFAYQPMNGNPQLGQYRNPKLEQILRVSKTRGELSLDSMNLTDQDMQIVVKLGILEKKCHTLSLRQNTITSVGAAIISQALLNGTAIYALHLDGNRILDAGVQFLYCLPISCGNASSTLFDHIPAFKKKEISDRGVRVLMEAIKSPDCNISLMTLSDNSLITDASVDSICSAMVEKCYFRQIHLGNCGFSPAGKERLQIAAQQVGFVLYV